MKVLTSGSRTPTAKLEELTRTAHETVEAFHRLTGGRIVLAWSGGKDSLVASHIAAQHGITTGVCEESFYFQKQIDSIREIRASLDLDIDHRWSLDWAWLRKHPEIAFTSDTKIRSWTFAVRQQATVKRFQKEQSAGALYGRRLEENAVKDEIYLTKAGWQCHPLRHWTLTDVWSYIDLHELPVPWIYSTDFGEIEGNAPFYTLRARDMGGMPQAWDLCTSLDPRYTPEVFA